MTDAPAEITFTDTDHLLIYLRMAYGTPHHLDAAAKFLRIPQPEVIVMEVKLLEKLALSLAAAFPRLHLSAALHRLSDAQPAPDVQPL